MQTEFDQSGKEHIIFYGLIKRGVRAIGKLFDVFLKLSPNTKGSMDITITCVAGAACFTWSFAVSNVVLSQISDTLLDHLRPDEGLSRSEFVVEDEFKIGGTG